MKLHMGNQDINLNNTTETLNLSLNEVVPVPLCTLTVNIQWWAAPNDISLIVNGEEFCHYDINYSTTTTHTHEIPVGSVVSFTEHRNPHQSNFTNIEGDIEVEYSESNNNNWLRASTFTVNGDGTISIFSSIEK